MANLIRSAKSGNEWTQTELEAYNIRVEFQDATTFFGGPLPHPTVRPEVLMTKDLNDDVERVRYLYDFMYYMTRATTVPEGDSSWIVEFLRRLFEELNYEPMHSARLDMQYIICGQVKHVEADFSLFDYATRCTCLLVQEDKRHWFPDRSGPEPQLIAGAIAAVAKNNFFRVRALGQPALEEEVMHGFTMTGTFPIFYKIPVIATLVHAVEE